MIEFATIGCMFAFGGLFLGCFTCPYLIHKSSRAFIFSIILFIVGIIFVIIDLKFNIIIWHSIPPQ